MKSKESHTAAAQEERLMPRPLSPWAAEIKRVKQAAWRASSRWQKLPQPLFWSLFHSVIGDIRRAKRQKRVVETIFQDGEETDS